MDYINNAFAEEEKQQAVRNIVIALSSDIDGVDMKSDRLDEIQRCLNVLFPTSKCIKVYYTENTDKLPFGIYINPTISNSNLMEILFNDFNDNLFTVKEYEVEIDSKLFMFGLSPEDITRMIIHDVDILLSGEIIDKLKSLIDIYVLNTQDYVSVKKSINANCILIYAIKDTLYKLYSSLYSKYDFKFADQEMVDKISKAEYENVSLYDSFPKVIILQWAFMVYKDIKTNLSLIKGNLEEAQDLTGSKLIKREIDKTITSITRASYGLLDESLDISKSLDKANIPVNEISIFKSLKTSGLRAIENDYYEFAILVKSASDENEAMYALRGINTRINILTDYLYNTPGISDSERNHWERVVEMYQELRVKLTKKNILNKKSYGIWFDYSKLDNLDNNSSYDESGEECITCNECGATVVLSECNGSCPSCGGKIILIKK